MTSMIPCLDCENTPAKARTEWNGGSIELRGCERHLSQLMRAVRVLETMPELSQNIEDAEHTLAAIEDWNTALPAEPHLKAFLGMCTLLGKLIQHYKQTHDLLPRQSRPVVE